jgi:hypothetical protein
MPALVILIAAVASAAAVFIFHHAKMDSLDPGAFWVVEPGPFLQTTIEDRTWLMLLTFAVLFTLFAVFVMRRASTNIWFFALAASSFPALAALLSLAHFMRAVKVAINPHIVVTDAGGDWLYWVSRSAHVHGLSIALCFILAVMSTYGYFARRKT